MPRRTEGTGITVGIITRNRAMRVGACVDSLMNQRILPEHIIILDSSSQEGHGQLLDRLSGCTATDIRCIYRPAARLAAARNAIMSATTTPLLAFIDDDCIADPEWLFHLRHAMAPHDAAVIGNTRTIHPHNIFSLCCRVNEYIWKMPAIVGGKVVDCEILDTKNILFNMRFVRQHRLRFDERLSATARDTNDDLDFGMQIQQAGGTAVYAASALAYHDDPVTPTKYWKKTVTDASSYLPYERKWHDMRLPVAAGRRPVSRNDLLSAFHSEYGTSMIERIGVRIVLKASYLLTLMTRHA